MSSVKCFFCPKPVNPHDLGTWKQVTGWVGGPRKDAMTLREDTGEYAHESCILKAKAGQTPDQPDLFEEQPRIIFGGSSHLFPDFLEDKS